MKLEFVWEIRSNRVIAAIKQCYYLLLGCGAIESAKRFCQAFDGSEATFATENKNGRVGVSIKVAETFYSTSGQIAEIIASYLIEDSEAEVCSDEKNGNSSTRI